MNDLFSGVTRTEYIIDECGLKIPYSDFDRPKEYYDDLCNRTFTSKQYAEMCALKDKLLTLYDRRWKLAKEVIDLIAREIDIDPEDTSHYLYGVMQVKGEFSSPLVERMRNWFDKSGDKVKLKKRITELEAQLEALRAAIKG